MIGCKWNCLISQPESEQSSHQHRWCDRILRGMVNVRKHSRRNRLFWRSILIVCKAELMFFVLFFLLLFAFRCWILHTKERVSSKRKLIDLWGHDVTKKEPSVMLSWDCIKTYAVLFSPSVTIENWSMNQLRTQDRMYLWCIRKSVISRIEFGLFWMVGRWIIEF